MQDYRHSISLEPSLSRGQVLGRSIFVLTEQLKAAVTKLVTRFCIHRRQRTGPETFYTELCPAYLETEGVKRDTAQRAWRWLRERLGWLELERPTVCAMGVELRQLQPGQRWGRHCIVTSPQLESLEAALGELGLEVPPVPLEDPIPRVVEQRGARQWVVCPWHPDTTPSVLLNPGGVAYCFGCQQRGHWSGLGDRVLLQKIRSKHSFQHQRIKNGGASLERLAGRFEPPEPHPADRPALLGGEHELRRIHRHGSRAGQASSRGSRQGDLLAALAHADRAAAHWLAHAPPGMGLPTTAGGYHLPDRYVSVDPAKPCGWRKVGEHFLPATWATTHCRWLLFDLDDAGEEPEDGWVERLISRVRELVRNQEQLSGRFAVLHTGPAGLQVVVELAQRWAPFAWRPDGPLRWLEAQLAPAMEAAARAAGWRDIRWDPSSNAVGKLMRLPGPRSAKERHGGRLFCARLVHADTRGSGGSR